MMRRNTQFDRFFDEKPAFVKHAEHAEVRRLAEREQSRQSVGQMLGSAFAWSENIHATTMQRE
jgi:hypothetical protein